MMKLTATVLLLFSCSILCAQVPGVKWEKNINTWDFPDDGDQIIYDAVNTKDKGFIVVGADTSWNSKNLSINKGSYGRCWIQKLDSNGNKAWLQFRKSYNSAFLSVQQTPDNGFITAGYAKSSYNSPDPGDYYVVKYTAAGSLQ